jgi:hypothetical protein
MCATCFQTIRFIAVVIHSSHIFATNSTNLGLQSDALITAAFTAVLGSG